MKKNEEGLLQAACVKWYNNEFIIKRALSEIMKEDIPIHLKRLFCINNNSSNVIRGSLNTAMGVKAGVSDMIFIGECNTLFLEFKTETGKQSSEQGLFEEATYCCFNATYIIIRSLEEFKKLIMQNF